MISSIGGAYINIPSNINLGVEGSLPIFKPENITVNYSIENPEIAVVSENGKIKGLKNGTTKLIIEFNINDKIYKLEKDITIEGSKTDDNSGREDNESTEVDGDEAVKDNGPNYIILAIGGVAVAVTGLATALVYYKTKKSNEHI